ncbi:biotin/lipoyl-binding protein, partial [Tardiphaga sp.]|uniref:efflux RND transporter periplasmic adaptor subunit n=1 Tax=Tardiphaga sp. TaxID=1926292 RepID=UPI0026210584
MKNIIKNNRLLTTVAILAVLASGGASVLVDWNSAAKAEPAVAAAPPAVQASVAVVEAKATAASDEFSGRLEAVERVEIRSRVAGAIQEIHFREGALVKKDDLLVLIDPALYAADVARADGQVAAAKARLVLTKNEFDRGQQLSDSRWISQKDLDSRINGFREAEANLKAAEAA